MPVDFDLDARRKFLRTIGLTLRIVSGTFAFGMAFLILTKMGEGMTLVQSSNYLIVFFLGGPCLYIIGLLIHRQFKAPPRP